MSQNSEMEAKAAILDKCCQSVECLARGKVFDLVGTLDLPQSSSPETDVLAGLAERLDRLFLAAEDGKRFVLATESANNIVEIVREWIRSRSHAQTQQQRIAAPGNDQLSKLWNAIVENTKGDGFWVGEILLTTLEREVGFNPIALTDTSTEREGK